MQHIKKIIKTSPTVRKIKAIKVIKRVTRVKKKPGPKNKTDKQKLLLKIISENVGKLIEGKPTETMYQMMLDAGYEESVALQQSRTLSGLRKEIDEIKEKFVEVIDDLRARAVQAIQNKDFNKEDFNDLIRALGLLIDKFELLSGRPTGREEYILPMPSPERQAEIDRIREKNVRKNP